MTSDETLIGPDGAVYDVFYPSGPDEKEMPVHLCSVPQGIHLGGWKISYRLAVLEVPLLKQVVFGCIPSERLPFGEVYLKSCS